MRLFSSLNKKQKEAIGLLQAGTFLEYFDLMLYVHLAVILNDLFFPKTDPKTAALLSAFAFCSTYLLRPFGALIFGYLGDFIGRKITVTLTTMMMAISCIIMANLPTYAQVGISAAYAVTLCRIIQGISSLGEVVGAEIYLTEIIRPPAQYPAVSFIAVSCALGSMVAIALATLVTTLEADWRVAFWIGSGIAMVGSIARFKLRETPDFVDMKRRLLNSIDDSKNMGAYKKAQILRKIMKAEKIRVDRLTSLAYFLVYCGWPVSFYFTYVYCGDILKNSLHYTPEQVVHQNFLVSLVHFLGFLIFSLLSYTTHPLTLMKGRVMIMVPLFCIFPYLLQGPTNGGIIFFVQSLAIFFSLTNVPGSAVFIRHFPVMKRFTYTSFLYSLTRALTYVVISFSMVYLTDFLGHWGILCIFIPTSIGFLWGLHYFSKLEGLDAVSSKHPMFQKVA